MAFIVTPQLSGPTHFLLHVYLEQDGTDQGELVNYVVFDPADYGLPKAPTLQLVEAWHSFAWFDATLKFGGLVPRPAWTFTRDSGNHVCFRAVGGLADRGKPPPSDDNGKVLLSTNGFGTIGSQGTLLLSFRR